MSLEKLLRLLADGQVHSGARLGCALGVSRAAVWKMMAPLDALGVQVSSVQSKGYRLSRPLELLDKSLIDALLKRQLTAAEKFPDVSVYLSLDSTNAYLHEQISNRPGSSCQFCFAEHQTAGRGRRGREWVSPFGKNLYFSLMRRFDAGYSALHGLSLALGVMVADTLLGRQIPALALKWPNDILVDGCKLAGILVELSGEHSGPVNVVIGVGLNLALDDLDRQRISQPVVALGDVAPLGISRNELAAELIVSLVRGLDDFEQFGFSGFRDRWNVLDYLQDKPVSIGGNSTVTSGIYRGVDVNGNALVEEGGVIKVLSGGEITVRVSDAYAAI